MTDFFEQDSEVYKHIPAGGHGGGITGSFKVKASAAEAAAFHAAKPKPHHDLTEVEQATEQLEKAVDAAEMDDGND